MLADLNFALIAVLVSTALVLDWLLGEARRWHPLVGFGRLASAIEKRLNTGMARKGRGVLAWLIAVMPVVVVTGVLLSMVTAASSWLGACLHAVLLYVCIGLRSLRDHALPIADALDGQDLPLARELTSRIVSRDTAEAQSADLAKAGVESLLENGNDAVFGTLFWFIVAGAPGAVLFRLANTLDAMWGYRNERFHAFGWAAARIDDVLNWVPARLTALSYALLGKTRSAWLCWQNQAPAWSSPNAGPVMAAGAGALEVALGGAACYDGVIEVRPPLGKGKQATAEDIRRAWQLVMRSALLWVAALAVVAVVALVEGVIRA